MPTNLSKRKLSKLVLPTALIAMILGMGWAASPMATPGNLGAAPSTGGQSRPGLAHVGGVAPTTSNIPAAPVSVTSGGTIVGHDAKHDVSPPLRDMKSAPQPAGQKEGPENP